MSAHTTVPTDAEVRASYLAEAMKPHFLIWSFRHQAWWRHEAAGYTKKRVQAGRFTFEDAMAHRLDPVSIDKDRPSGDALILEYGVETRISTTAGPCARPSQHQES